MKQKYTASINQLKQVWDGKMSGVLKAGKICAQEMTDPGWAVAVIKSLPQFSLLQLEALRDVGEGKIIPELAGPRSLAEQQVAREWPVEKQLKLITTRIAVAVRRSGAWVKEAKFLYDINDYGTIRRVFDMEAKKVRSYDEQTSYDPKSATGSENGRKNSHRRVDRLIRAGCTKEEAIDIEYLLSRQDEWGDSIWQLIRAQRKASEIAASGTKVA